MVLIFNLLGLLSIVVGVLAFVTMSAGGALGVMSGISIGGAAVLSGLLLIAVAMVLGHLSDMRKSLRILVALAEEGAEAKDSVSPADAFGRLANPALALRVLAEASDPPPKNFQGHIIDWVEQASNARFARAERKAMANWLAALSVDEASTTGAFEALPGLSPVAKDAFRAAVQRLRKASSPSVQQDKLAAHYERLLGRVG